jgi:hypothetical protein
MYFRWNRGITLWLAPSKYFIMRTGIACILLDFRSLFSEYLFWHRICALAPRDDPRDGNGTKSGAHLLPVSLIFFRLYLYETCMEAKRAIQLIAKSPVNH